MADYVNRNVRSLVARSRSVLGMTQRQFGEALGSSHRTAERWDSGRSAVTISQVRTLAQLVFPVDQALAGELAGAASETLVTLGLVPPPASLAIPKGMRVDAVVSAAAEALRTYPSAARAGLAAAFAEARAQGLDLNDLAQALTKPTP